MKEPIEIIFGLISFVFRVIFVFLDVQIFKKI